MARPRRTYVPEDREIGYFLRLARVMKERGIFVMPQDGSVPNAVFGIWRGGSAVATWCSGALKGYGIPIHTYTAAGKSYEGEERQSPKIEIFDMEEKVRHFRKNEYQVVCGIDDVYDTGRTGHAFRFILRNGLKKSDAFHVERRDDHMHSFDMRAGDDKYIMKVSMIRDIPALDKGVRVLMAAPHWKRKKTITGEAPDVFVKIVGPNWKVYPWEAAEDLTLQELRRHYPRYYKILYG